MSTKTGTNKMTRPQRPPGPRQHWLSGNLREFSRDRLGALTRWQRQYGDLVWARFGPRSILFLNHPDLVEEVLVAQNRKFIKHYRLRTARRTLGNGLLTSEGEFWRTQRKLMAFRSRFTATPTSPLAAARGSASATTSP